MVRRPPTGWIHSLRSVVLAGFGDCFAMIRAAWTSPSFFCRCARIPSAPYRRPPLIYRPVRCQRRWIFRFPRHLNVRLAGPPPAPAPPHPPKNAPQLPCLPGSNARPLTLRGPSVLCVREGLNRTGRPVCPRQRQIATAHPHLCRLGSSDGAGMPPLPRQAGIFPVSTGAHSHYQAQRMGLSWSSAAPQICTRIAGSARPARRRP